MLNRKIFLIITGMLLMPVLSFSQLADWRFSVNFTPSLGWASASEDIKSDGSRFSLDFAFHAEKYFKERYAFYSGLSFVKMGGKFKNISNSDIVLKADEQGLLMGESAKYSIQYLTIPVGIKLKTPDYGLLSYYFQGGLMPGIRVGSSIILPGREKQSMNKDLNLMTCATQLSLGCMYATGDNTYLRAGLLFNYFFVDAARASNLKVLPTSLGIQIGFLF